MNLAAALERERLRKVVRVPCGVSVILDNLTDEDREALAGSLSLESTMTHAGISRALKTKGHVVSQGVVGTHRNGECSCEPR